MVGASKILTVSYGTFSCTLEGFDDPFSTMRGIAEYFRDLAADDRYFGAEPPTPDAEMLHRIAQAEVERRVEARVSDDGIVLRQVEKQDAPAPAPQKPPVAYTDTDEADNMFADLGDADDEAAATSAAFAAPATGDRSVAAKLSRIRAVVSGAAEASAAEFSGPIEDAFADVELDDDADVARSLADDIGAEAEAAAPVGEPLVAPEEATFADATAAEAPAPVEETPVEPAPQTVAEAAPEQVADAAPAPAAEPGTAPAPAAFAAPEPVAEPAFEPAPVAEIPAEVPAAAPFAFDAPQAPTAETDLTHAADMSAQTEAEDTADLIALDGVGSEDMGEDETDATAEEEADLWAEAGDVLAPEASEPEAEVEAAPEASEPKLDDEKLGLAARIVQLKRAAMGEVVAEDAAEDEDPELEDFRTPIARDITLLDDDELYEDEADDEDAPNLLKQEGNVEVGLDIDFDLDDPFARETADVETAEPAETMDVADDLDDAAEEPKEDGLAAMIAETLDHQEPLAGEDTEDEDEDEDADEDEPRAAAFDADKTEDAAFDRILEQTNSRMDDSEGNRRRSAIAHLKAAVAATKADRLMKRKRQPEEEAAEEQSQYRDDLAQVVRPRRAEAPEDQPRDTRPEPIREVTAPLVLVSEQRVDADDVAPRRVASEPFDPEREAESHGGFKAFAEKMGATELPDLLEAAAAYSAFVEGQREFSRPQLMRRVAHFEPSGETFTREAGLRSFGQLLRQGKIQKLKRGQFTITEDTRFNPEARIAGE